MTIPDINRDLLWYLATPYSHPDKWMRKMRFKAAARIAGRLYHDHGIRTFCPIAHTHPVAMEILDVADPNNSSFWCSWDEAMVQHCDGLLVAELPGWERSSGIKHETEAFVDRGGLSVIQINPRPWFTETEWGMLRA